MDPTVRTEHKRITPKNNPRDKEKKPPPPPHTHTHTHTHTTLGQNTDDARKLPGGVVYMYLFKDKHDDWGRRVQVDGSIGGKIHSTSKCTEVNLHGAWLEEQHTPSISRIIHIRSLWRVAVLAGKVDQPDQV